jgi:hypothetical protein
MTCAQDGTLGHEGEALNVTGTRSNWLEFDVIPIKDYAAERCAEYVGLTVLGADGLGDIRIAICTGLAATWCVAASAQQMLPSSGSEIGSPPAVGLTRGLPPQAQSIAPYTPPGSPAMPLITGPAAMPVPALGGPQQVLLSLVARFGRDVSTQITNGLVWRVFPARPDVGGKFRPIKEDKTASPVMTLPAGDYVVHVSFGLASAAKAVHLKEATREVFELPAGAIKLEGRVGDVKIATGEITFDIFKGSQFEPGYKTPLAQGVLTGDLVVVPEGNYHIVSNYGDTNAVVRSDIRVQAGKLTDVTVSHRAALITLKLVGERGGDPIANTNWSVITPGGDVIKESTGVFPRLVLAEGDYRAIARNEGRTYERDFKVVAGVDGEVEVLER